MKRGHFLLASAVLFSLLSFIPLSVNAAWSVTRYIVEPRNVIVGQSVAISIVIESNYEGDGPTTLSVDFGDGGASPDFSGDCSGSQRGRLSNCGFQLHHRFTQPGTYTIGVTLSPGSGKSTTVIVVPAAPRATPPEETVNPITAGTLPELMESMVNFVYWIGNGMVVLFVLWGGFIIISAAGNPQGVEKGKNTIFYALIAFAIMTMARGIFELITAVFGVRR